MSGPDRFPLPQDRDPARSRLSTLWPFKKDLLSRWFQTVSKADIRLQAQFNNGAVLPLALSEEWEAEWVTSVFLQLIPAHEGMDAAALADSVSDVQALVDATFFLRHRRGVEQARRVIITQEPMPIKFDKDSIQILPVDAFPPERPDERPRFYLGSFLRRVDFLLNDPSADDERWGWLRCLGANLGDRVWSNPPQHVTRALERFQVAVPVLSRALRLEIPDLYSSSLDQVANLVNNWCLKAQDRLHERTGADAEAVLLSDLAHFDPDGQRLAEITRPGDGGGCPPAPGGGNAVMPSAAKKTEAEDHEPLPERPHPVEEKDKDGMASKTAEAFRPHFDRLELAILATKHGDGEDAVPNNSNAKHSPDFASVVWYGTTHRFTSTQQRAVVHELWAAWENGTPDLTTEHLREAASISNSVRIQNVFRGHAAWGTMIVTTSRGLFRLQPPA